MNLLLFFNNLKCNFFSFMSLFSELWYIYHTIPILSLYINGLAGRRAPPKSLKVLDKSGYKEGQPSFYRVN